MFVNLEFQIVSWRLLMFKCPECGHAAINEHEVGPTITREVQVIDTDDFCTVYDTYWVSEESKMWWTLSEVWLATTG